MNFKNVFALAIGQLVLFMPLHQVHAQGTMGGHSGMMMEASGGMAEGLVRKVDKDAGKLTIKHGPIPSMDMPPMTMVYRVKDAAMLDRLKAGDKVKFQAEKIGGAYTVTRVEAAK